MLKGFIIGLALTIIVGQVPKLFGVPKGEGDFFEQTWDFLRHLGDTQGLTLLVGALSLALVLGSAAGRPWSPRRWSPSSSGIIAVDLFHLDQHGRRDRRPHRQRAAQIRPARAAWASTTTSPPVPRAVGIMLVGFAEGLGAAKTYARRGTTTRSTPTAS